MAQTKGLLAGLLGGGGGAPAAPGSGGLLGGVGDWFENQRATNPEFLTSLGVGLMTGNVPGAFEQINQMQHEKGMFEQRRTADMEDWNWKRTVAGEEDRQSLASEAQVKRAEGNQTAKVFRDMGPEYAPFAAMAEAGFAREAFGEAMKYRATGKKSPDLESIYNDQGQEQKGYFNGSEFVPVGGAKALEGGGLGKPPSGFMWDPNDQSRLAPIPGGPGEQIPGELAARVGLADNFLTQVPDLLEKVERGDATGPLDRMVGGSFSGSGQAEVMRGLQSGTDALMRMLTGAGMNQTEAEAYARRYLPTYTDNASSAAQKVKQLDTELRTIREKVMQGRGGTGGASRGGGGGNMRSKYGLE